jgi:hypothetical protein
VATPIAEKCTRTADVCTHIVVSITTAPLGLLCDDKFCKLAFCTVGLRPNCILTLNPGVFTNIVPLKI